MKALLILVGFLCVIAAAFVSATSSGDVVILAAACSLSGVVSLLTGIAWE